MKLKSFFYLIAIACAISLQSCDDDNDVALNPELQKAFAEKYPAATRVEWEMKSGYYVADFRNSGCETSAWFSPDGVWYMTETDVPFNALSEAIKSAFNLSEYAAWRVDDVDKLERPDMETMYIIEVETKSQGYEREMDLYYSTEGLLIKAVADADNDSDYENLLPSQTPDAILTFINEAYPGYKLVELESEHGITEVDIIHEGCNKEILFDQGNNWISTSWDIYRNELPAVITQALANSQYSSYTIDDADYFETPQGNYYLLELEQGEKEVKVRIHSTGIFL